MCLDDLMDEVQKLREEAMDLRKGFDEFRAAGAAKPKSRAAKRHLTREQRFARLVNKLDGRTRELACDIREEDAAWGETCETCGKAWGAGPEWAADACESCKCGACCGARKYCGGCL